MNPVEAVDREIEILESIYHNQDVIRQRDLAKIVGLSLGRTNAIVKDLAQKGWLKIRKVNNRNIHYIVSPAGQVKHNNYSCIVLVGNINLDFLKRHVR